MPSYLDFEAPVAELEGKIAELRALAASDSTISIAEEVKALEKRAAKNLADLYDELTPVAEGAGGTASGAAACH